MLPLRSNGVAFAKARERAADPTGELDTAFGRAMLRIAGVLFFPVLMAMTCQFTMHLSIPVPPYGIPLTLQTLWVLLAALSIGPRLGMVSMGVYVLAGVIGAPIFAGGDAGIATILGQTGGYIVGFIVCQPVVAAIVRRGDGSVRGWGAMALAVLAAHLVIFVLGVPWLWAVRAVDPMTPAITFGDAVHGGFVVFIIPMLLKAGMAVLIGRWAVPWAARNIW